MPALHLIFSTSGFRSCLTRNAADDVILLLQDGVYAQPAERPVLVLGEHARSRGLESRFEAQQLIDWDQMVRLTTSCSPVVSWR
jgi:sulfur relay protein TusB/DsrH